MEKQIIIDNITKRVNNSKTPNFSNWQIGLTHDPNKRKEEHEKDNKNIKYWEQWIANSLSDAEQIESYFINDKNMKGGTGGNLSPNKKIYVYIF